MSTGRVIWIIWCCFWAGMWALSFFFFINLLAPVFVVASLAAILLPVGKPSRRALADSYQPTVAPLCARCGQPAAVHINGWCPPGGRQG